MAGTVLGKRHRNATTVIESSDIAPPSLPKKRRTRAPIIHDEGKDPSIPQKRQHVPQPMEIDGPQQENESPVKHLASGIVTSKHTVSNTSPALSPTKTNALLGASKPLSDENTKAAEVSTPKIPRYKDALSNTVPITPKHRVKFIGKPQTPRAPRTPSTPRTTQSIYGPARLLFARSSVPGRLVGREIESKRVASFISDALRSGSGGCMYVSGPPGTGKSATVEEVCRDLDEQSDLKIGNINCMSMKTSKDVYGKLIEEFSVGAADSKKSETQHLEELFVPKRKSAKEHFLVVLDEIDHLLSADLEVLYRLFEWSMHRNSNLILIGIANALDLTDRLLPRLKARNLKPTLLPFHPYTAPQIASVINTRLESLLPHPHSAVTGFTPFVHPAATQLCSKKVASQTGDLRKAFDIVRRAIDQVERETIQKHQAAIPIRHQESPSKAPLAENMNLSSTPSPWKSMPTPPHSSPVSPDRSDLKPVTLTASLATLTPENAPRATIAHIARITSAIFNNGTTQRLQSLNLQQKAALCSLVSMEKRRLMKKDIFSTPSKTVDKAPTVKQLFEQYCSLCKRDNVLHPLTATEFRDVMASLETLGLVGEVKGKTGSLQMAITPTKTPSRKGRGVGAAAEEKQLASNVSEMELETAIQGMGMGILQNLLKGEDW